MNPGWCEVTIGDVCTKPQYGWTTKARADGGEIHLLRTTDITSGQIDWPTVPFCAEAPPEPDKYLVRENDIVISRAGSVGVSHLISHVEPAVFASYLIRFRPGPKVRPKYLAYFLKSPGYWKQIADNTSGIAIPNVNASKLQEVRLPLAPLDDQDQIVAEIEKQFSRLDEAVAGLKRVKANLKRYKAAVLKAAVEGRLVPTEAELACREGRSYETGTQLLQRILETRRSRWQGKAKYKEPVGTEATETNVIPDGWTIASLDQLAGKITSGSRDWSPFYNRGSSIFVLAQNVRPIAPDFSMRQLVDPPKDDPSRNRSRIETGDLLATIVGANTGQVCAVGIVPGDAYVCQSVALIRPTSPSLSTYLNYWLNSEKHGQRYFESCMYGQGRPHLSFEQLMMTPIAVPPLAEQHRIVAEIDRHLSIVREVEAEVEANLKRAQALRQSTLSNAFRSERLDG